VVVALSRVNASMTRRLASERSKPDVGRLRCAVPGFAPRCLSGKISGAVRAARRSLSYLPSTQNSMRLAGKASYIWRFQRQSCFRHPPRTDLGCVSDLQLNCNSENSRSNHRACPLASIPTRNFIPCSADQGGISPLPRAAAIAALAVPHSRYLQKQLVGSPGGNLLL
jgi:hypothetical protein